ncbi:MAG: 3-phosphoshikimate 1-carboxyvinyltransferase [Deltaproteobacteria bacterium]|nr:3-phosphoshikimate 1-carboxyvinyltransferase [Deltaproteobacteria bacterium]
MTVQSRAPIRREVVVPGDKSLSHRALLFAGLAEGTSRIRGLQGGLDVAATRRCLEAMGVAIRSDGEGLQVEGRGVGGLTEAADVLDCANSGTSIRLLSGVLAGHPHLSVLSGDEYLRRRPMARVLDPLREMGALAVGRAEDTRAPLVIRGGSLRGLTWTLPVASAQVKSAVLLAGLHARGTTWVEEPAPSRDHTERMLQAMGADVLREGSRVGVRGPGRLKATEFPVPGDPSSAAFWVAAALLVPGSRVRVRGVCLNPTRTGFFRILQRMGAPVLMQETGTACGEPVGDIVAEYGPLVGVSVARDEVPSAIDEFPALGAVAAVARGETEVTGAEELRHKESDRIDALAAELRKAGVAVETFSDGMRIAGGAPLQPARFQSHGDHRLAMALAVLALAIPGGAVIEGAAAAAVSYPGFWQELLGGG